MTSSDLQAVTRRTLLSGLAGAPLAAAAGRGKPNIVILLADDLGWNDVGFHGSEIQTPALDRLASRGVVFDRCYSFPVCSPTRAALMTGRSPLRMGIDRPIEMKNGLPVSERLMPEYLKDAGYQTMMVGKWHLGLEHVKYFPNRRGFDQSYGHLGPAVGYHTHIWAGGLDWHRNGKTLEEPGYTTDLIAAEAICMLRARQKTQPVFLYVAFNAPHIPLEAPPDRIAQYAHIEDPSRRTYAAMVTAMDAAIQRILDTLDTEKMAENTIVLWFSDNGGAPRGGGSNKPLRMAKSTAFEGGIRVPAAAFWPGVLAGGRKITAQVTAMDWLPTLAEAAGVPLKNSQPLDGQSMWPTIRNGQAVSRQPVIVGMNNSLAVFDGSWKLVHDVDPQDGQPHRFLFRIDEDPSEEKDLAGREPAIVARLGKLLDGFPIAPSISPEVRFPGPGGFGPGGPAGQGKKAGPRPAAGGFTEVTRRPWAESASREE